jgi:hypothetical protein
MSLYSILVISAAIVLLFLLIRFVTKILAKVLAVVLILAAAAYFLFIWNGGLLNMGSEEFLLYELKDKYCMEENEAVKCECIIDLLLSDVQSRYTAEEIDEIRKSRMETMKVLKESVDLQKDQIELCLKNHDADITLDDFLEDLKNLKLGKKLKEMVQESPGN